MKLKTKKKKRWKIGEQNGLELVSDIGDEENGYTHDWVMKNLVEYLITNN